MNKQTLTAEEISQRIANEKQRCEQHKELAAELKTLLEKIQGLGGGYYNSDESNALHNAYKAVEWKEFEMPELPAKLLQA